MNIVFKQTLTTVQSFLVPIKQSVSTLKLFVVALPSLLIHSENYQLFRISWPHMA